MKKFIPYIISLFLGSIFGFIMFEKSDLSFKLFDKSINATAFQLGVFTDRDSANVFKSKYSPSIIVEDDDVFRVYYSILTDNKVIKKMENYLNNEKIAYYKKDIIINNDNLIESLNDYESAMIEGNDTVLVSLNKIIMNSYEV